MIFMLDLDIIAAQILEKLAEKQGTTERELGSDLLEAAVLDAAGRDGILQEHEVGKARKDITRRRSIVA